VAADMLATFSVIDFVRLFCLPNKDAHKSFLKSAYAFFVDGNN